MVNRIRCPAHFWLSGMAGTGKSTIASTVAQKFAEKNCLGASFLFSRGGGDLGHAHKLFGSIALQLARSSIALKSLIVDAVAQNDDIAQQFLREQWRVLILDPLRQLDNRPYDHLNLIIVLDVLDECKNESDIKIVLQLLTQLKIMNA